MDILKKSIKAFVICIVLFIMLTALASLLMQTGILPGSTARLCMYVILSLCCFFAGLMAAGVFTIKGILSGIGASIVFVIFVWCGISLYTGEFNPAGLINKMNFIPAAAGMMGGIVGSNTKK